MAEGGHEVAVPTTGAPGAEVLTDADALAVAVLHAVAPETETTGGGDVDNPSAGPVRGPIQEAEAAEPVHDVMKDCSV